MTRASLVVPSYRGADRLPTLLQALTHRTHDDWECIVVIDGDLDNSTEVIAQYAAHLPVRTIVLPTNQGRVTALNTGFAAADGDVIIRCDDDFEPAPGHIAAHLAVHADHDCGAVGLPRNIAPDNAYMRVYGRYADEVGRRDSAAVPDDQRWRIFGGNTSISRAVYETVGDFDLTYRGYGWEDLDYGYRIQQAGYPIELVPGAEVLHHMASVTTAIRAERAYRSGAARRTFESRHGAESTGSETGSGWWDRAVHVTARGLTLQRAAHLARTVDVIIDHAPVRVGRKLVALTVEASAVAGHEKGLPA